MPVWGRCRWTSRWVLPMPSRAMLPSMIVTRMKNSFVNGYLFINGFNVAATRGFQFNVIIFCWMALFGWITCSSLAYIYGQDESSQDDFLLVNGREYPRKIVLGDGKSLEISQAIDGFVCRALPSIVMDLKLPTLVSTLEKFVREMSESSDQGYLCFRGRLLDTMSFVDALPSFRVRQWQVIVLLFLDALSVHRLPPLAPHMTNKNILLHKIQTGDMMDNVKER